MSPYIATLSGMIIGVVGATINLLVAFGVHVTPEQRNALVALATAIIAVGPLVGVAVDHLRHARKAASGVG